VSIFAYWAIVYCDSFFLKITELAHILWQLFRR
jgi:hypothetical protein